MDVTAVRSFLLLIPIRKYVKIYRSIFILSFLPTQLQLAWYSGVGGQETLIIFSSGYQRYISTVVVFVMLQLQKDLVKR